MVSLVVAILSQNFTFNLSLQMTEEVTVKYNYVEGMGGLISWDIIVIELDRICCLQRSRRNAQEHNVALWRRFLPSLANSMDVKTSLNYFVLVGPSTNKNGLIDLVVSLFVWLYVLVTVLCFALFVWFAYGSFQLHFFQEFHSHQIPVEKTKK